MNLVKKIASLKWLVKKIVKKIVLTLSNLLSAVVSYFKALLIHIALLIYNSTVKKVKAIYTSIIIKREASINNDYKNIYSDYQRHVEILNEDKYLDSAIFTCYFINKVDPQHNVIRSTPDINYIMPWYSSILTLKVKGIIFHDGLDQDFILLHQNEYVQFRKCLLGKYSIFEERWIILYMFLKETCIKSAFYTDIQDVYIKANPFKLISDEDKLFVGRDNHNKIYLSTWMLDELNCFKKDSGLVISPLFKFQPVFNAGVVGGKRRILLFCLSHMLNLIFKTNTSFHKDMTLINLVIFKYFPTRLYFALNEKKYTVPSNDKHSNNRWVNTGFPLNSEYKKHEYDSSAFFIHK